MAVGGVDTYYDYDERQWKYRRLGGGPVHKPVVCPEAHAVSADDNKPTQAAQTAQTAKTTPRRTPRAAAHVGDG